MPARFISFLLLFTFTLYCLTGCSAKEAVNPAADAHNGYVEVQRFPVKKDELFSSCIYLLQDRGYIINFCDQETGLINAEFSRSGLIDEETQEINQQNNTCINILTFILLVGFIFLLISSFNSDSDNSDSGYDYSYEEQSYDTEMPVSSYKYNLMLMISSVNTDTAACRLTLIRSDIENGSAVSETALKSKTFNLNFFNDLRKKLAF